MNDKDLLEFARFMSTKFDYGDGWTYTRDLDGLEHIRYRRDSTGYHHWTKRLARAVNDWNPFTYFRPRRNLDVMFRPRKPTILGYFRRAWAWSGVALSKEKNLPDGRITGAHILTYWEEDGHYITLFQPAVGEKVLDFIEQEPNHPHAQLILTEMRRVAQLTWPDKQEQVSVEKRPEGCCGVCPPLCEGGFDCTCPNNPRCPNYQHQKADQ